MNKSELVKAVRSKVKDGDIANNAAADRIINAVFNTIMETVGKGEQVAIVNFGTFSSVDRAERNGVNPSTKETIVIPAKKSPKFAAGKGFKDAVNK